MKEAQQKTGGKTTATPKNNEKPGFFKRMGRGIKETFGELKKVSWPTFGETMKQLGIVIAVVLFFLVILMAFDYGLSWAFKAFTKGINPDASLIAAIKWLLIK